MNSVELVGYFTKEFEYSHTTNNTKLYKSELSVPRSSGVVDYIPIYTKSPVNIGPTFYIHGELRVINRRGKSQFYVYPDFLYSINEQCSNKIELEGRVVSHSQVRKTPKGKTILDCMLIVGGNKTYKIPLIFWNTLANTELCNGDLLHIKGRLQSRSYIKNDIERTILEVSVNEII